MTVYLIQRLFWTVPVLLAIATITFVLMHFAPGGPWTASGKHLSDEAIRNLNREYGLDEPLWRQYGTYLVHLAQGDLGISTQHRNEPVNDVLANKIRVSATLGLLALATSVALGVTMGVVAALHRNRLLDYVSVGFATLCASVPSFILAMLLLIVFTSHLHWLDTSGWGTPKQAIMPVLALSALPAAYIARVTRASMLDVLQEDYVRTARAKGLATRTVMLRHMLRNAAIPVLTVIGPIAATLVTGSFIIEHIFSIRGIGYEFVQSVKGRDLGMIMGLTLFYTFVVAMANLAVDVLYAFVDPRIRYESHG